MKYERYDETYPEHQERTETGAFINWGQFGYPDAMLSLAMTRDDPRAFEFYFSRYFSLNGLTIGGSIPLLVARRGAEQCLRWLLKQGAKDDAGYTNDELIAFAQQERERRARQAA